MNGQAQHRARLGVVGVASAAVLAAVSTFVALVADRLAIAATAGRRSWGDASLPAARALRSWGWCSTCTSTSISSFK